MTLAAAPALDRQRRKRRIGVAAAACACAVLGSGGAARPLAYDLLVTVIYPNEAGPESLRDEVEAEVAATIDRAGCFRSVRRQDQGTEPKADLLLRVAVLDVREQTSFDSSLAQQAAPDQPPGEIRMTATIEADLQLDLLTEPDAALVRWKRFTARHVWQPMPNEDGRQAVVQSLVEELVGRARSFVCQGSPEKWARQIARARAAAAR